MAMLTKLVISSVQSSHYVGTVCTVDMLESPEIEPKVLPVDIPQR
jgi:hypothetical protein